MFLGLTDDEYTIREPQIGDNAARGWAYLESLILSDPFPFCSAEDVIQKGVK